MNIEEQIKIVKNMLLHAESQLLDYEAIAIETLLTAYEKEKGENIKLRLQDIPLIEGELKAYKDRVYELKLELEKEKEKNKSIIYNYEMVVDKLENSTSNDKIKAKIEELDYNDIGNFERRCKQEVLQSLLEKE